MQKSSPQERRDDAMRRSAQRRMKMNLWGRPLVCWPTPPSAFVDRRKKPVRGRLQTRGSAPPDPGSEVRGHFRGSLDAADTTVRATKTRSSPALIKLRHFRRSRLVEPASYRPILQRAREAIGLHSPATRKSRIWC